VGVSDLSVQESRLPARSFGEGDRAAIATKKTLAADFDGLFRGALKVIR
jgi:hypothetical protein